MVVKNAEVTHTLITATEMYIIHSLINFEPAHRAQCGPVWASIKMKTSHTALPVHRALFTRHFWLSCFHQGGIWDCFRFSIQNDITTAAILHYSLHKSLNNHLFITTLRAPSVGLLVVETLSKQKVLFLQGEREYNETQTYSKNIMQCLINTELAAECEINCNSILSFFLRVEGCKG